jgi:branched-chain amino acid transport system ATP-binding protein
VATRSVTPAGSGPVPRLDVVGLSAGYGGGLAISDLSMTVGIGECVALLGRNGAGKSTTMLAISGALPITAGTVAIDGADVSGHPAHDIARRGVSLVPQGRRVFPRLSVEENLTLGARDGDLGRVYDMFPVLAERRRHSGAALSGGEQQMLAIGRALMTGPRLVLLDEPSEGLAPNVARAVGELIGRLGQESGLSIVLAEQDLKMALGVTSRVYVLEIGRLVHSGASIAFGADRELHRQLLGA